MVFTLHQSQFIVGVEKQLQTVLTPYFPFQLSQQKYLIKLLFVPLPNNSIYCDLFTIQFCIIPLGVNQWWWLLCSCDPREAEIAVFVCYVDTQPYIMCCCSLTLTSAYHLQIIVFQGLKFSSCGLANLTCITADLKMNAANHIWSILCFIRQDVQCTRV